MGYVAEDLWTVGRRTNKFSNFKFEGWHEIEPGSGFMGSAESRLGTALGRPQN